MTMTQDSDSGNAVGDAGPATDKSIMTAQGKNRLNRHGPSLALAIAHAHIAPRGSCSRSAGVGINSNPANFAGPAGGDAIEAEAHDLFPPVCIFRDHARRRTRERIDAFG